MTNNDFDEIVLRSNSRFDILFNLKLLHEQIEQSFPARQRKKLIKQHELEEKGIIGPCILRELTYFDVGHGFMAYSLHNIYIGLFVCRLCRYLDIAIIFLIILETSATSLV